MNTLKYENFIGEQEIKYERGIVVDLMRNEIIGEFRSNHSLNIVFRKHNKRLNSAGIKIIFLHNKNMVLKVDSLSLLQQLENAITH